VTFNHGVEGSSPSALTKENQRLKWYLASKIKTIKTRLHTLCTQAGNLSGSRLGCEGHRIRFARPGHNHAHRITKFYPDERLPALRGPPYDELPFGIIIWHRLARCRPAIILHHPGCVMLV
jgi:hypothetical protein